MYRITVWCAVVLTGMWCMGCTAALFAGTPSYYPHGPYYDSMTPVEWVSPPTQCVSGCINTGGYSSIEIRTVGNDPADAYTGTGIYFAASEIPTGPIDPAFLYNKWVSKYGSSFNVIYSVRQGTTTNRVCMVLWDQANQTWSGKIGEIDCSNVNTQPTITCSFGTPSLLLDHGTLAADGVNGSNAENQLSITCTGDATVRVGTDGSGQMPGSNITSQLSVNGKLLGIGRSVDLPVSGIASYPLRSTLVTGGGDAMPGKWEGSYVLVLTVL